MKLKLTYLNVLTLAAAVSIAVGAFAFIAGFFVRSGGPFDLAWALLAIAVMIGFAALMRRFRLTSWLTVTLIGYIVGLVSAMQLLAVPNVVGGYAVAVLTLATFTGHGLIIGMFAEFIVWLHRITHGLLNQALKEGLKPRKTTEDHEKVRLPENRD